MSNSKNKDYLLFIAKDTLQEIRENRKDQRAITYNFIIIVGVLFGFFSTLKTKFDIQIYVAILKFIIAAFGIFTVYFIIMSQRSLSQFRKRMTKIWDDKGFSFAFENDILKYKNDCKEQYFSFWNHFFGFTFAYILIVLLVTIAVVMFL